ncbi:sensor histidine kinase [Planococcus halocryophilus]|uniref:sensor histidine kinase n=1 Tax=Planococcus halocryophilus TaxID=1215089 RepID=UPI001F0DFF43|nr:sensor histidine kinase [Planococcus halocryophilus]MCH4826335.1 histidine kinase [Planococcus halocryophilus]
MKKITAKHHSAQLFMMVISLIGWSLVGYALFHLPAIEKPFELLMLLSFIFICEHYPMPFRKGNSSLTFPIVFLTYLIYGIEMTIVLYFLGVLLTTWIYRRPLRIIFFNPAQLVLSFMGAHWFQSMFMPLFSGPDISMNYISLFVFIALFYIINNLIIDIVLLLRPEKYTVAIWAEKGRGELFSFGISLVYGFLLYYLGGQNRGEVDIFSYFFFLSPLIFLAIISSTILRLRADKQRLKALFHFSSELNKSIPTKEWDKDIKLLLSDVVFYEESFLFTKDDQDNWHLTFSEGSREDVNETLQSEDFSKLEQIRSTQVFNKQDLDQAPLSRCFDKNMQVAVYAPLILDNELIGCLILTKIRTNSFVVEDVHSISTISNQLAIFLKTQLLFSEKEQRILLEERNRIAHDIHDGIAQTLAGAVMKFDSAARKIPSHPQEAQQMINDSNNTLREGLKEIRDSIYALRPHPTENLSLDLAIQKKIAEIKKNHNNGLQISFDKRGVQTRLSLLTEKVIYSITQESIQNCIKHAQASSLNILLSYQKEQIFLKIKDDGVGFSLYEAMTMAMKEPHYGILQMNEDAAKVGATLQIESSETKGTEIIVRIPKMGFEGGLLE